MSETNRLEILESKLDIIIRLLSKELVTGKNITESILILNSLGMANKEIELITGAGTQTVRNRISESKKMKSTNQDNEQ
jgi:hypothetical protein